MAMYPPPSPPKEHHHLDREGKISSLLHSIRKSPPKPCKKPAAARTPSTRVYVVDPPGFRQLVQKLTGAPESAAVQCRRDRVVPPPLLALPPPTQLEQKPQSSEFNATSPQLQLFLSSEPTKYTENSTPAAPAFDMSSQSVYSSWCSYPLLSPGTLSSLEQSTV